MLVWGMREVRVERKEVRISGGNDEDGEGREGSW